jgi:hypothetical protein
VFVIGNMAFHPRQKSRLPEGGSTRLNMVSPLRLIGGAVVGVFGRDSAGTTATPRLAAAICGTRVYMQVMPIKAAISATDMARWI